MRQLMPTILVSSLDRMHSTLLPARLEPWLCLHRLPLNRKHVAAFSVTKCTCLVQKHCYSLDSSINSCGRTSAIFKTFKHPSSTSQSDPVADGFWAYRSAVDAHGHLLRQQGHLGHKLSRGKALACSPRWLGFYQLHGRVSSR